MTNKILESLRKHDLSEEQIEDAISDIELMGEAISATSKQIIRELNKTKDKVEDYLARSSE